MDSPLFAALFDEAERRALTVSELNADIKGLLESRFASVWVEGEITNFHQASSGHWYFSLTDGETIIKAACYRGQNYRIRFMPSDGLHVRCRGRITAYEKRGEYQLMVESLEPVGEGALTVAFEQIKARLFAEGLFDEALKRPLPSFPRRVGIITSPDGAAVHDIMTVLDRRARSVSVVVIPSLVQGELAAGQIAAAIRMANDFCDSCPEHEKIDVLIVGRGGGSAEDLWAFNEERVARAIRSSRIPVISAVGHEIDLTIADLAADHRAATPTAAAEIIASGEEEVKRRIGQLSGDLRRQMEYLMLSAHAELQSLEMAPVFTEFPGRLKGLRYRIDELISRASARTTSNLRSKGLKYEEASARLSPIGLSARVAANRQRLALLEHRSTAAALELTGGRHRKVENMMARLDALSPLAVLTRGYSITQKESGEIVRNSHQIRNGERLSIRLSAGKIEADVVSAEE